MNIWKTSTLCPLCAISDLDFSISDTGFLFSSCVAPQDGEIKVSKGGYALDTPLSTLNTNYHPSDFKIYHFT